MENSHTNNQPLNKKQKLNTKLTCELKEYAINIRAERLNNKMYRIFFINIARQVVPISEFKFEFQYSANPWRSANSFDCNSLRLWKQTNEIFTYVRVPSQVCDYQMNIRLALKFKREVNGYKFQEWMHYSDILNIKVLSSLNTAPFQVGSYVKFRPANDGTFYYGKIEEISSDNSSNVDNQLLNKCTIKNYQSGKTWKNVPTKILLQLLADDYIDLCIMDRNYADCELLFRSDTLVAEKNQFNIYCALVECSINISESIYKTADKISTNAKGRCFAYNVMRMLIEGNKMDYNLKLNCLKDCGSFVQTKQVTTIIKHRIDCKQAQDWSYGCDICRTSVNEYDYMFHCDNVKELTHDFCVLCVYEMVKKHKHLTQMLYPLLLQNDSLNIFCIDILVSFMVGKVKKFKITHK